MRAGEPSRTASVVAKSLALTGMCRDTRGLVDSATLAFARQSLLAAGHPGFVAGLERRWFRRVVRIYESLMDLDPGEMRKALSRVSAVMSPGSRLMFSFMSTSGFRRQSPVVRWWLGRAGEPFRWWLSPERMDRFLRDTGLAGPEIRSTAKAAKALALPAPAEGELLCEAQSWAAVPSSRRQGGMRPAGACRVGRDADRRGNTGACGLVNRMRRLQASADAP